MAYLDVSDVLLDPELADIFTVIRRAEAVSSKGRSTLTPTTIPNVIGVICAAHGNDLDRLDDSQRMGRHISIVTQFRLIGPAPGQQPDNIEWQGDTFVILTIEPYPQYGKGFIQAIAGSVDMIDQPTPP